MKKEKKIRIMHVAQAAGGVERYLRMLFKYINKDKYENILVCSKNYTEKYFTDIVDEFIVIDMAHSVGLNNLKSSIEIRKLIKKYNPDIVYGHSSIAGALVRIADVGLKNKRIYNPHGWAFNMQVSDKKRILYVLLERVMSHFCDKIVCISNAEKESALDKKICSVKKMNVIFNGIDIEEYQNKRENSISREKLGIPNNAIVIGTVGRLSKQKAPDIFIKVAKRIKENIDDAFFIMVGSGSEKEQVIRYAKENGLADSLIITDWVDNPMSYMKLFDIAVLLSRWEGFGLVLAEYMLAEKPIVSTNVDAIPNIIKDGKNGLLANVDDVYDISEKILELVYDKKLKHRLVKYGKIDVRRRFNVKRVAMQHEILFDDLMKSKFD